MVFLGTLGAASTVLALAVMLAPGRFGLVRSDPSTGEPIRAKSTSSPKAGSDPSGAATSDGGESEPRETDVPLDEEAWELGAVEPSRSLGYLGTDRSYVAEVPFALRPTDPDLDPFAPRPTVLRVPSEPTLAQRIFEDARASVAHVTTLSVRTERTVNVKSVAGTGSGLVWDQHGHIVTSRHVIENVNGANVTLSDGSQWKAKLIGVDDDTDIAVLQIAASPDQLVPIRVGTSSDLVVGMSVFSVACPYGLGHSLSTGSISGLNRSIHSTIARELHGTIQTDAPLHPGSSGGALIDDQGRVIGMNAAIHLDSDRAPGVGFALPIDRLQEVVPSILQRGPRWYPKFGFMVASAEDSESLRSDAEKQLQSMRLPGGSPLALPAHPMLPESGLVIFELDSASVAAEAGLRGMLRLVHTSGPDSFHVRDIIVRAGQKRVSTPADLDQAIRALRPGEPLQLGLWRRGGEVPVLLDPTGR